MIFLLKLIAGGIFGWLVVKVPGDALAKSKRFQEHMKRKYEK